jgi:hypothetical protein
MRGMRGTTRARFGPLIGRLVQVMDQWFITLGSRWSHDHNDNSLSWTCSVEIGEDVLLIHEINSSPWFWMEMEPQGPVVAMTLHRGPARVQLQPHGSGLAVEAAEGEGVGLAARRLDGHHDGAGAVGS